MLPNFFHTQHLTITLNAYFLIYTLQKTESSLILLNTNQHSE